MELTSDELEKLEEYAALFLTVDEISLLLSIDARAFKIELKKVDSDIAKRYFHAKIQSKLDIRRQVINYAKRGSPQAELTVKEYISNQTLSER